MGCRSRKSTRLHIPFPPISPPSSHADAALNNLTLTIEPAWVRRGQSAQLHCEYELNGAPLYSVKWYRGNLEFYRFSPFENPPAKIFPYTGIKVDVSICVYNIAIYLTRLHYPVHIISIWRTDASFGCVKAAAIKSTEGLSYNIFTLSRF